MTTVVLDDLLKLDAKQIRKLDATTGDYSRTDSPSNSFNNQPTWDNWSNR